jgi:hypothetical protein
MKGVKAFYNYEFDHSIDILDQARNLYPKHPGVHFIWSSAKYYVSQGIDPVHATYDTLDNTLDQIEPVYKRFLEAYPDNNEYRLYLGSTRGLRARSSLGNKDWLSVLVQAYKGFSIIEQVAQENPLYACTSTDSQSLFPRLDRALSPLVEPRYSLYSLLSGYASKKRL